MKKSKILLSAIALLIFTSYGNSQQFHNLKKAVQPLSQMKKPLPENFREPGFVKHFISPDEMFSKPGTSEDYVWDEENNEWVYYSNTFYTYSETGILLIELSTEAQTGAYLSQYTHDYDENGNLIEEASYFWNGLEWIISGGYRYEYIKDGNGRLTDETGQTWNGSAWENEYKNTYVYNGNNVPDLILYYEWDGSNWTLYNQYVDIVWHNFENGEPESYILQLKIEGGLWVNEERYHAVYDGANSTSVIEKWLSNNWVNSERDTYTKDTLEETIKKEYWTNDQWVNFEQYTYTFDEHGNTNGYQGEIWSGSQWDMEFEYFFEHTYNSNADVTETIVQFWEPNYPAPMNISRYLYSDFLYFTTDVPDSHELDNVMIYPNPVKSSVTVQIHDPETSSFYLDIIDLSGKTLFTGFYSYPATIVNLDQIKTGIYMLRLRTNSGKDYSQKLIKE